MAEDLERPETAHQGPHPAATDSRGVHTLMSETAETKRDPLTVPLIGLLLAFLIISLILQMLIAFS